MGQLDELIMWIEKEQVSLPQENMSEIQKTISATLEYVKKQAEFIVHRDSQIIEKNKTKSSPGHYGC